MNQRVRSSILLALCPTLAAVCALAAETRIQRTDLPSAVLKTADEQTKGATIRGYSKEKEGGRWEYEVETTMNGMTRDVAIAPDGTLLEVEAQVSLESLSAPVRSGLAAKAGAGKILKVESITKLGAIVAYEAQVERGGKRSEVQTGPDGKGLDHEE